MAITLGGLSLDGTAGNLFWSDEFKIDTISQTIQRTLGGQLVVYELELSSGIDITLVALSDQGWLTKAQVTSIRALANAVTTTHVLNLHGQIFNVIFRHDEPPAVDFDPLIPRSTSLDTDFYTGTIKLRTV